uniref:Uncharacterized protein n=1 Tax=Rhinolophus ferrumequinum TaxID=59479 RepID=A0A671EWZ6_RHIFE
MRTDASNMTDGEPAVNNAASSARAGPQNAGLDTQGAVGTGGSSESPLKLEALSRKISIGKAPRMKTHIQLYNQHFHLEMEASQT